METLGPQVSWSRERALRIPVAGSGGPCLFPSQSLLNQDHRESGLRRALEGPGSQCPGRTMGRPGNRTEAQRKFLDTHSRDEGLVGQCGLKAIISGHLLMRAAFNCREGRFFFSSTCLGFIGWDPVN